MNLSWINVNNKLKEGISLINSLETPKFILLLNHIKTKSFSGPELSRLKETLEITTENIELLTQTLIYIHKQSSKVILKPTVLHKQLTDQLKLHIDKTDEFVKVWTAETKERFGDLENRLKLEGISWEIDLQASSTFNSTEIIPKARIQLELSDFGSKRENVLMELNEGELTELYDNLENIQMKLDKIQS